MWQTIWNKIEPYLTLRSLRQLIKKACGDMFTNWNGDVDPARLVGYGFVILGGAEFLALALYDSLKNHTFNYMGFSTGLVAISGAITAAAAGVRLKQLAEAPMPPVGSTVFNPPDAPSC
jgi:hypothetical protein